MATSKFARSFAAFGYRPRCTCSKIIAANPCGSESNNTTAEDGGEPSVNKAGNNRPNTGATGPEETVKHANEVEEDDEDGLEDSDNYETSKKVEVDDEGVEEAG